MTLNRAKLDGPMRSAAAIKLLAALLAYCTATIIANDRARCPRAELLTTLLTNGLSGWPKPHGLVADQFRMRCPKFLLLNAVAGNTKSTQIVKLVRRSWVGKQAEWSSVMHRQSLSGLSTPLACVSVPFTSLPLSARPVWATVFIMSATPSQILCARLRSLPRSVATGGAKSSLRGLCRSPVRSPATVCTDKSRALRAWPLTVDLLPFAIAPEPAEMPLTLMQQVGLDLIQLAALFAVHRYHSLEYYTWI